MTGLESEKMSDVEGFAHAYYYFVKALEILAADADTQCAQMGNYNVAWELKDDVSAGSYLLTLPGGALTVEEKNGIAAIVSALNSLPASVLVSVTTEAESKMAMSHPCWAPLRAGALKLLDELRAATARNEAVLSQT